MDNKRYRKNKGKEKHKSKSKVLNVTFSNQFCQSMKDMQLFFTKTFVKLLRNS